MQCEVNRALIKEEAIKSGKAVQGSDPTKVIVLATKADCDAIQSKNFDKILSAELKELINS